MESTPGTDWTPLNGKAFVPDKLKAAAVAYQLGSYYDPPDDVGSDRIERERYRVTIGLRRLWWDLIDPHEPELQPVSHEEAEAYVQAAVEGLPLIVNGLNISPEKAAELIAGAHKYAVRMKEKGARPHAGPLHSQHFSDMKAMAALAVRSDEEKRPLEIIKARPLAAMRANQPVAWIDALLYPKTVTAVSSVGGTGKTTLNTQILCDFSQDKPILGMEELQSRGKTRRALYVNGEDHLSTLDYLQAPVVAAHGLDELPFDLFPIQESEEGFVLTAANSRRLAEYVADEGIEIVAFDPVVSLLPEGIKIIDPPAVRAWQRSTLGLVQKTGAAVLLYAHDNKAGQAFSGTVDFSNFARLALHFQAAGYTPEGDLLTLTTVKTNLSWRFSKLTLLRDPHTRCCRVTDVERMGEPGRGKVNDPAEKKRILARIVRNAIVPLPSEQRTKVAVQALLVDQAAEHGISRQEIRDFITTSVTYVERKVGRTGQHVVTGVREEMIP